MGEKLEAVVHLFPGRQSEIARLLKSDETFAAICRDLADAQLAYARWSAEPGNGLNAKRVCDYRRLISDLASEIQDLLDRASPGPPGN